MRILFIGDVVGKSGREKVKELTKNIREQYQVDYVICNAENSAHGKGITKKIYYDLLNNGIDFITLGNHAFSKSEIKLDFHELKMMIRPGNFKDQYVGDWYKVVNLNGKSLCICNLLGASFMDVCDKSPFVMMEDLLNSTNYDLYFCDLHGETTAEKIAFAYYFKDRLNVVVGTHTHVQTADNRIIGKCAYISDVGMCGAYESVIGRDINETITRFTTEEKTRFTVAENEATYCAVVIDIDDVTLKSTKIERIYLVPELVN